VVVVGSVTRRATRMHRAKDGVTATATEAPGEAVPRAVRDRMTMTTVVVGGMVGGLAIPAAIPRRPAEDGKTVKSRKASIAAMAAMGLYL